VRAFWRGHSEAWKLSGLTQREYCILHGLSLKNFGNWRGQLKREAAVGHLARWGRYPRLRPMASHVASHMAKKREKPTLPAPPVDGARRRREFSEDAKRRLVAETTQPGRSVSEVARRYGIGLRLLLRWRRAFGIEPLPSRTTFMPVQITDAAPAGDSEDPGAPPAAPSIIVERPAPGIEIELSGGRRVRFAPDTDPDTVKRIISALEGAEP
jgi:transposase